MFFVSLTPNSFADIMHNPHHPDVIQDTARSILRVHKIAKPDIVLVGHPGPDFFAKGQRAKAGQQPSPMMTTDAEWTALIKSDGFYEQLYSQSHGKPPEDAR
jgi:hypothetical protein